MTIKGEFESYLAELRRIKPPGAKLDDDIIRMVRAAFYAGAYLTFNRVNEIAETMPETKAMDALSKINDEFKGYMASGGIRGN